jgi:hypothetical protein
MISMKSPFPGMDPFIEAGDYWGDFHDKLIGEIERELSARVPDRYVVRLAKRSYIELSDPDEAGQWVVPDVGIARRQVSKRKPARQRRGSDEGVAVLEQPVTMRALIDTEYQEPYLEIYERRLPHRLVTSIEVLSPANKRADSIGWRQYVHKRQIMLHGAANFVEIDLLRGGQRMPMSDDWPASPYYLLVARREVLDQGLVWPAFSVRPLPQIPVPLLPSDPDLNLSLQPLIDAVYQRSRYDIDYRQTTSLPLSADEIECISTSRKSPKRSSRNQ